MTTDCIIICLGGFIFKNIDAVLYGVSCTYVQSLVIDRLLYGSESGKLALIITDEGSKIAKRIDSVTGRGATLVRAVGTYSGNDRQMLICACGKAEITKVREEVYKTDPKAFVMITDTDEV